MSSSDGTPEKLWPRVGGPPDDAFRVRWIALLYSELRALAQSSLASERAGHTLSATALVNEVYIKLSKQDESERTSELVQTSALDRGAFFGLAAQAMRRILVDHARTRGRTKRGGGLKIDGGDALRALPDDEGAGRLGSHAEAALDPIDLDAALTKLAIEHEQAARVVELRFFAGLAERTIAEVMGINERTVRRHWTFAKAWLAREMNPSGGGHPGSE